MPVRAGSALRARRPHRERHRHTMLFLVLAVFLFGVLLGTAGHVPAAVTVVAGIAITAWLAVFFVRERHKATTPSKEAQR
ncbi:hypothetical protein [Streptomyces bugieae]|uniref:Small hydrophobic membrane protein n=1 Tax=Streptomyces bugieae TaxID=3098223 RepID=A0ABU7NGY8_9ACTN|nr:hypothetical protein [Streptomyces sp. DSM 41528]